MLKANILVNLNTMKRRLLFALPLISILLTGCGFGTRVIDLKSTEPTPIDPFQPDEGDGYKKYSDFDYNIQDVKESLELNCLPSKGDSYLLVVPIQFKNTSWSEIKLEVIRRGFFGKAEETSWQSVSSFYEEASYKQLHIKGELAPVLDVPITKEEASLNVIDGTVSPDALVVDYFEKSESYNDLRKSYDKNGDGYIDSVAFVYPNSIDPDNGYWAWVYWNDEDANKNLPVVNSYLWMSYYFFSNSSFAGYGSGIDAHTAIHESGHLMGLDDYYQYDEDQKFDPSGGIEMHSYNIGDENIYSKFALGWANPYYVKTEKSVTLKLRSSAYYGDSIIINDNWNGNSMDEYIMIEYYTPEGLNFKDAVDGYKPNTGSGASRMYSTQGFRIYHIDSRLVELDTRGAAKGYVDTLPEEGLFIVGASNSPSRSYLTSFLGKQKAIDYKYVHLLESNGINTFKTGSFATNKTLFKQGSSFVATSEFFPNGSRFNNEQEVGYRIDIGECLDNGGEITITRI